MDQLFVAGGQSIGASADGGPYLHELLVYKKSCHRMQQKGQSSREQASVLDL